MLDDLTAWIRSDTPGEAVKSIWRPTRQRFGSLVWQGQSARLGFDDQAAARFLQGLAPGASGSRLFSSQMYSMICRLGAPRL